MCYWLFCVKMDNLFTIEIGRKLLNDSGDSDIAAEVVPSDYELLHYLSKSLLFITFLLGKALTSLYLLIQQ